MKQTRRVCKRRGCSNPARKQHCSAACRAAAWRETHLSLGDLDVSCPHCLNPIRHLLQNGNQPRSKRKQGPITGKPMRRGE